MASLRFAYSSDSYINEEGIYIDDITPVPAYDSKTVIAAEHPDTFIVIDPDSIDTYAYRVRAKDGEGHLSRWSSLAFYTVTVYVDSEETPPAISGLKSVYPNPFNPRTTVRYMVGREDVSASGYAPVRLEVFDVAGRKVSVIEDGYRETGSYLAAWDGTVSGGGAAASGIYFMRLTIGPRSFSRKTVLLR